MQHDETGQASQEWCLRGGAAVRQTADAPAPRRSRTIDRHLGIRLRERRTTLGLSQQQFALMIGVSNQQAHKYECGLNRIPAGRLYDMSQALDVPVEWFFIGLKSCVQAGEMPPACRMLLELMRNFALITDNSQLTALSVVARGLAMKSGDSG